MEQDPTTREKAATFAHEWAGRGNEDSDTQQFWMELLGTVLDVPNTTSRRTLWFERPTADHGKIDALMTEARVLVEQKSLGVDLDKPETRRDTKKTPIQQAWEYAKALPPSEAPSVLITCNFGTFRLYDLEQDPLARKPSSEFQLTELAEHINELGLLFSHSHSRIVHEEKISVEAGKLVARLYKELESCYPTDVEGVLDEQSHTELAWLTVRIVFCLYADRAGLFPNRMFLNLIRTATTAQTLGDDLYDLFMLLDQPKQERRRFLSDRFKDFPYVDGGLFAQHIDVPQLTQPVWDTLQDIAQRFDWSRISPVVFGSLMEETLSGDQRRKGGMHYTSVKNIHRLIEPLFLDRLTGECDRLLDEDTRTMTSQAYTGWRKRVSNYLAKLSRLQFLDPACGSGNFLTETFINLRRLENRCLAALHEGVQMFYLGDQYTDIQVSISQMHGIEINGFACAVARTALWIAEQQMIEETQALTGQPVNRLPFTDSGNIIQANALQLDWNTVLDSNECDYVMGNPPFIGQRQKTLAQRNDMKLVWGKDYDGYLDYVTGWFRKASRYCVKPESMFAFVATSSICQGQPVPALFRPLQRDGWRIRFAWTSFPWDAQSTTVAGVAVVIIGFDRDIRGKCQLFHGNTVEACDNINAYLASAPDVFVGKRMLPFCDQQHSAVTGLKPADGGMLLVTERQYGEVAADPIAAKYLRYCVGADELLNGRRKWCLWLQDASPKDMKTSRFLRDRVNRCREYRVRAGSKPSSDAYKLRDTPWLMRPSNSYPLDSPLVIIPSITSEKREWLPVQPAPAGTIVTNRCFVVEDADGFQFALHSSRMFLIWLKSVGGRLEERLSYSSTIVWNNLPLPHVEDSLYERICQAGQQIMAERNKFPDSTLFDLYERDFMPMGLRRAHERLDRLVDEAFGASAWLKDDDDTRLSLLFADYATLTEPM